MCLTIIIMISSQSSLPFSATSTMSLCSPYWLLYASSFFFTLCYSFSTHHTEKTQDISAKHVKKSLNSSLYLSIKITVFPKISLYLQQKATISSSLKIIVNFQSLFLNLYLSIWLKLKKNTLLFFERTLSPLTNNIVLYANLFLPH